MQMKKEWCFIFLFALIACGTQPKQEPDAVLAHQTVEIKNDYLGKVGPLIATADRLYGVDFLLDTCLYCINPAENTLQRFGTKGQGANEFLYPGSLQYVDENTIGVFDVRLRKYSEIDCQSGFKPTMQSPKLGERLSFYAKKLPDGQYIGIGPYDDGMFTLFDTSGVARKCFYEYPYRDTDEKSIKNALRAMAYQGIFVSNPSKDKLAFSASHGEILHFYQWKEGNLELIRKIENQYPDYLPDESGNSLSAAMKKENRFGYISLYATDQYLYALYSGETMKSCLENNKEHDGDQITIFNWEGEEVKTLKLDIRCISIAVTPDDKILYGIANNPDPELERFDLNSIFGE